MKSARIAGLMLFAVAGTALSAEVPNWIAQLVVFRLPQVTVVRDDLYLDQYVLCWEGREGRKRQRYGMRLAGQSTQDVLQTMSPGERVTLDKIIAPNNATWTARDAQLCWGS